MKLTSDMQALILQMKAHAKLGQFNGHESEIYLPYMTHARQMCRMPGSVLGSSLLFTRDIGYHTSGWFKNPDYERCWHLSIAFFDLHKIKIVPYEYGLAKLWVHGFYGDDKRYIWSEPPANDKAGYGPWHYRVFCDVNWDPIKPRGEAYNREFIEKGWMSFSDLQYYKTKQNLTPEEYNHLTYGTFISDNESEF